MRSDSLDLDLMGYMLVTERVTEMKRLAMTTSTFTIGVMLGGAAMAMHSPIDIEDGKTVQMSKEDPMYRGFSISKKTVKDEVDTTIQYDCVCAGGAGMSAAGGIVGRQFGGPVGEIGGSIAGETMHQGMHFMYEHRHEIVEEYNKANDAHMKATGKPLLGPSGGKP